MPAPPIGGLLATTHMFRSIEPKLCTRIHHGLKFFLNVTFPGAIFVIFAIFRPIGLKFCMQAHTPSSPVLSSKIRSGHGGPYFFIFLLFSCDLAENCTSILGDAVKSV